jgi:hypothetical protein
MIQYPTFFWACCTKGSLETLATALQHRLNNKNSLFKEKQEENGHSSENTSLKELPLILNIH